MLSSSSCSNKRLLFPGEKRTESRRRGGGTFSSSSSSSSRNMSNSARVEAFCLVVSRCFHSSGVSVRCGRLAASGGSGVNSPTGSSEQYSAAVWSPKWTCLVDTDSFFGVSSTMRGAFRPGGVSKSDLGCCELACCSLTAKLFQRVRNVVVVVQTNTLQRHTIPCVADCVASSNKAFLRHTTTSNTSAVARLLGDSSRVPSRRRDGQRPPCWKRDWRGERKANPYSFGKLCGEGEGSASWLATTKMATSPIQKIQTARRAVGKVPSHDGGHDSGGRCESHRQQHPVPYQSSKYPDDRVGFHANDRVGGVDS